MYSVNEYANSRQKTQLLIIQILLYMTRKELLRLDAAQYAAAQELKSALEKCSDLGVELVVFVDRFNYGLIRAFSAHNLDDFCETAPYNDEAVNFASKNDMEIIGGINIAEDEDKIQAYWAQGKAPK